MARPTDQLEALAQQYHRGLGLSLRGRFEDHDGFDGVILTPVDDRADWELELTHERGCPAPAGASPEHLLVVYVEDLDSLQRRHLAMLDAGFEPVGSNNPYWDRRGRTYLDLDGYRVVVARLPES